MRTIRRGVFETNSSSVHSLSIVETREGEISPKGQTLIVIPREYGRGGYPCETAEEKLSYLFSLVATSTGIVWMIEEDGVDFSTEEFLDFTECQQILRAVKDHDCKLLFKLGHDGYGRVDHQSSMSLSSFMIENNIEDLEDFIFHNKYVILIEGD